jgi:tetratricopeptide (TPR) repeat protein
MTLGGALAILLTLAILAGAIWSLWRFARQPTPERLILNGLGFGVALVIVYMALKVPSYGQFKAFYGLVALLPLCVFGAEVWETAGRHRPWAAGVLGTILGTWALLSFVTYWIPSDAAQTHLLLGDECGTARQWERAVTHFNAALKAEPRNALVRSQLASALMELGRTSEARQQIQRNLVDHPDAAICHLQSALIALGESQSSLALEHTRRALELAPDCAPAHSLLVQQLQQLQRGPELIAACRESLRVDPWNPQTHLALGVALAAQAGTAEEAREHLRTAGRLAPASVSLLNSVAWALATHANDQVRDGQLAVQLAGRACELSGYKSVTPLVTLAAAQAEIGRYEDAAKSAVLGQQLAVAAGQSQLAAQCASLGSWFHSGRPYRQR